MQATKYDATIIEQTVSLVLVIARIDVLCFLKCIFF